MSTKTQAPTNTPENPSLNSDRSGLLQRKCECGNAAGLTGKCSKCQSKPLALQRKATQDSEPDEVPPIVYDVLNSPGQPLDPETRTFMESRFKHDFSQVRVHTDAKAAESAQAVNALAYATEHNIVFGAGRYKPESNTGKGLLAHELTHVVQQQKNVSGLSNLAEFEANQSTMKVDLGQTIDVRTGAPVGLIQKAPLHPETISHLPKPELERRLQENFGELQIPGIPNNLKETLNDENVTLRRFLRDANAFFKPDLLGIDKNLAKSPATVVPTIPKTLVENYTAEKLTDIEKLSEKEIDNETFRIAQWINVYIKEPDASKLVSRLESLKNRKLKIKENTKPKISLLDSLPTPAPQTSPQKSPDEFAEEKLRDKSPRTLTVGERFIEIEHLLRTKVTVGFADEHTQEIILGLLSTSNLMQTEVAEFLAKLSSKMAAGKTYIEELDHIIDGDNNIKLHEEISILRIRAKASSVNELLNSPVLPWHDVMGLPGFDDAATFSSYRAPSGMIVVKYHDGKTLLNSKDFKDEVEQLPKELFIGGYEYSPDQLLTIHDYDSGRYVPIIAQELIAYQHKGLRKFLGDIGTVAQLALPVSAARTAIGRAGVLLLEKILPAAVLLIEENRLFIIKHCGEWGKKMLYYSDIVKTGIAAYGILNFVVSGYKIFQSWKALRRSRVKSQGVFANPEAETLAIKLEESTDSIINEVEKIYQNEVSEIPVSTIPANDVGEGAKLFDLKAARQKKLAKTSATKQVQQGKVAVGAENEPIVASSNSEDVFEVRIQEVEKWQSGDPFDPEEIATENIRKPRHIRLTEYDPWKGDSTLLGKRLKKQADLFPPGPNYEAHHIVPAGEAAGTRLRNFLRKKGFKDINHQDNGVWLSRGSQTGNVGSEFKHEFTMENLYGVEYFERLEAILIKEKISLEEIHFKLQKIREYLMSGKLPPPNL